MEILQIFSIIIIFFYFLSQSILDIKEKMTWVFLNNIVLFLNFVLILNIGLTFKDIVILLITIGIIISAYKLKFYGKGDTKAMIIMLLNFLCLTNADPYMYFLISLFIANLLFIIVCFIKSKINKISLKKYRGAYMPFLFIGYIVSVFLLLA